MSLESSSSLWDMKPWWCQPWSIILTGITIPVAIWFVSHRLWLVIPVIVGVLGWWFLFLVLVPKSYAEYGLVEHTNQPLTSVEKPDLE